MHYNTSRKKGPIFSNLSEICSQRSKTKTKSEMNAEKCSLEYDNWYTRKYSGLSKVFVKLYRHRSRVG